LFQLPDHVSLAHCVSQDFRMGKGIAARFKAEFGHVSELKSQKIEVGGVGYIDLNTRYIFYLVTKQRYSHRPSYLSLQSSLLSLRDLCIQLRVKELGMPRIGCGLDRLEWYRVREIILEVFQDSDIRITVCSI
jgi:O-acetyl-ADP-ribose deacetylase (regulator of RNase III)